MAAILQVRELSRRFGGHAVIDDLTMDFAGGKITGLIGPNGAGKTTLFNLVSGFLAPDRGEIWLAGERVDGLSPTARAQRGLGRLFQDVRIFERLTVLENLLVARRHHPGETPWGVLFTAGRNRAVEEAARRDAARWLEQVGLAEFSARPAGALSYGQQKLLAIARLMVGEGRLLLLDEPTAGVSPAMVRQVLALLRELAKRGVTLVVVEHNMTAMLEVADWVYFLDHGRATSFGLPQEVLGDPEVRRTYLGA